MIFLGVLSLIVIRGRRSTAVLKGACHDCSPPAASLSLSLLVNIKKIDGAGALAGRWHVAPAGRSVFCD